MSAVHQILSSPQYSEDEKTDLLQAHRQYLMEHVQILKESTDSSLAIAETIKNYSVEIKVLDNFLNSRRGLDGMTPIHP